VGKDCREGSHVCARDVFELCRGLRSNHGMSPTRSGRVSERARFEGF
jgi:hypothetical protein